MKKETEKLRKALGTASRRVDQLSNVKVHLGVEEIDVQLIDSPRNPYKSMYILATSCWGWTLDKWKDTQPRDRFRIVKMVLEKKTLPLAAEAPKFTFTIEGPSRASFDQIARARVGVVFSSRGTRDNNWSNFSFRLPNSLAQHQEKMTTLLEAINRWYFWLTKERNSWQAARCILPMNICHGYSMSINLMALQNLCARRCCFAEQEDTTGTSWLLRQRIVEKFPLLGNYLRPACDFAKRCLYHRDYGVSEIVGCLFSSCGRNHDTNKIEEAEFNKSCSDKETIEEQLKITIPGPKDWIESNWKGLCFRDKRLFEEE